MTSIWNLEKKEQNRLNKAGVDYDLSACLEYNSQSFDLPDIEKVLAVWEGENDEDDWRWIIKVTVSCAKKNGGRFVYLQGGCDYTGWDCRSSANSQFTKTKKQALELSKTGLGWSKNDESVYLLLKDQLESEKNKTWHEKKDIELGVSDLDKI
jgi:hypothetical protein